MWMSLWLFACAPTLPETLSEAELYGSWIALGTESDRTLRLFESETPGWQHSYQRIQSVGGQDPEVSEQGSYTLLAFELSFNPEGEGVPTVAQVRGFDGQELQLAESGLVVRYTLQP